MKAWGPRNTVFRPAFLLVPIGQPNPRLNALPQRVRVSARETQCECYIIKRKIIINQALFVRDLHIICWIKLSEIAIFSLACLLRCRENESTKCTATLLALNYATNSKNRERIREHKVFLVETLCEEADVILQHAHQEKLITPREYRNLKDVVNREKMTIDLLDKLMSKGEETCCNFSSHGRSDGVYGTDKNIVSVDEIREPFNGSNCRNLAGKPKLFFIQACRGSNSHNVVRVQADDPEGAESELEVDAERMEVLIPVDSDFLIARSTIDRYYSFRDTMKGSWFIQSLCKQLETHCPQGTDIQTILLAVNHDVSREGVTRKQMPVHEVAMGKKLILHVPNVQ
ncbi:Caspase-8 [Triplophysa tibetana]|uniref:Caspase-8 n=1 Tax=Triplophysa tibetana TaxID=1572043 RepID=A0A5A9NVK7_9TELE|nr:Caspase-8 [Triplophysa tibetana]